MTTKPSRVSPAVAAASEPTDDGVPSECSQIIERSPLPASIAEVVERFQRDVIACVIDRVVSLLAPLTSAAATPSASSPPALRGDVTPGNTLAHGLGTPSAAAPPKVKRVYSQRRSRAALAALTETLAAYVARHPGKGIEAIGVALRETTRRHTYSGVRSAS